MSKDLVDVDDFTSPIHVPEGTDSRDDAAGDVELVAQRLANRTRHLKNKVDPLDTDAARKSQQNTFTKSQIINTELAWSDDPLVTTTAKPGDDPTDISPAPAGSNRWKLVLACPTQGAAWAGIFVGQSPYGAVLANNARWHVGTQKWRQLDNAYPSTAMVGRSGQYAVSYVPAGTTTAWADWPLAGGGDFIAGGNVGAALDFLYVPSKPRADWTVPLASASGETFLQADGSYKVGPDGAAWPLKIPGGVTIGFVRAVVDQASTAQSFLSLVRRNKGDIVFGVFPTADPVASANGAATVGLQGIQLATDGHVIDGNQEYSVMWKRGHADDKIGRICVFSWADPGPRNLG